MRPTLKNMGINLPKQLPIDYLSLPKLQEKNSSLGILRLDLLHPVISGNKWFKLAHNLQAAIAADAHSLLTFGGAYSNHLIATAAAAKSSGLTSIGIVRGWHGASQATSTLIACEQYGMQLHFISREEYRQKASAAYIQSLAARFPNSYLVPEGGNNAEGLSGAAEIAQHLPVSATHIAVSVGSGTTMAGIASALPNTISVLGFCAMKNGDYLEDSLSKLISKDNWTLVTDAHEGGFGKQHPALIKWMNQFYEDHQIPLDFVYTAKMMKRIWGLIESDFFEENSHIICIHTGGLQGNSSIAELLSYP